MTTEQNASDQKAILQAISESSTGLTRVDLVDIFGFSYGTAVNRTNELIEMGLIEIAPTRGRAQKYTSKDVSPMPKLGETPVWELLVTQAAHPDQTVGGLGNIHRNFLSCVMEYFVQADNQFQGTKVTKANLNEIRANLIKGHKALTALLKVHDAFINNAMLGEPAEFAKLLLRDKNTPVVSQQIHDIKPIIEQLILRTKGQP